VDLSESQAGDAMDLFENQNVDEMDLSKSAWIVIQFDANFD
jgi:hypothetical protein